jgi:hypothetical protein
MVQLTIVGALLNVNGTFAQARARHTLPGRNSFGAGSYLFVRITILVFLP